ncbi:MAG: hypothetical protein M3R45_06820 [Pseudomonadota bacterium]|nr:hypothetical protein [Pseudomonadota bacterium]
MKPASASPGFVLDKNALVMTLTKPCHAQERPQAVAPSTHPEGKLK